MRDYVIGFDVGGTRAKSGAVTRGGRMLGTGHQSVGVCAGHGQFAQDAARRMRADCQTARR